MKTLTPSHFMTVGDKHHAQFALNDKELSTGATLLYVTLFKHAGQKDHCWPSQSRLASLCKCSQRSIKAYLRQLIHLQYLLIEKQGLHNIYRLLLSPRIQRLIDDSGMFFQSLGANSALNKGQKTSAIGENSAPRNKNKERRKTHILEPRVYSSTLSFSPSRPAALSVDSFSLPKAKKEDAYSLEFERIFNAYPAKKDKLNSARTYAQLTQKKRLPRTEELLFAIERMKNEDRHWQAGYAPSLRTWLHGERWKDEPVQAVIQKHKSVASMPNEELTLASGTMEKLQTAVKTLQQTVRTPQKSNELDSVVTTLQTLWTSLPRGSIFASIGVAKCRGISASMLLERAENYLDELQGATPAMPLKDWMQDVCYATC